jgi:4-hydroxysphinganine ceramide fatty acyl 2-hydroxylase
MVIDGKVYDVTGFVETHPGGDVLLDYHGEDASEIMRDAIRSHNHSDAAYQILEKYCIGVIGEEFGDQDSVPTQPILVSSSSPPSPFSSKTHASEKNREIFDLNRPIFAQLWYCRDLTLGEYLRQIHTPRMPLKQVRFFAHPFLELFSRTYWWMIPAIWLPCSAILFHWCTQYFPVSVASALFLTGIAVWTVTEYVLHRFVFHLDDRLPDNKVAMMLHFTFHGIHHLLPMDRYVI